MTARWVSRQFRLHAQGNLLAPTALCGPLGVYLCPELQPVMVDVPPESKVPLGPCTATGTFWRLMFSRTMLPAVGGCDEEE